MITVNREELAWAAGFFDGEGHITARRNSPRSRTLHILIPQTDPRVLYRFKNAVLGIGKVSDTPSVNLMHPNWKPRWNYWAGSFENCQAIAIMLWPFLSEVKRDQVTVALQEIKEHRATVPSRRRHSATLE